MDNIKLRLKLRVGSLKEKARPTSMILKPTVRQTGSDSRIRYSGSDPRIFNRHSSEKRNTWKEDYSRERTHRYVNKPFYSNKT